MTDAARLFRLLPVDPGPDVSTEAAAALAAWPPGQTRTVFGQLAKAHLVEAGIGATGRWRMHDLLRLYACQITDTDAGEREQAIDRLLSYYVNHTSAADAHLRALAGSSPAMKFKDRNEALAWLDMERPNLIAAVAMAAATGRDEIAVSLPTVLSQYLSWRRRFDDLLAVLTISRDSAHRQGKRANEVVALNNLGAALQQVGRFEEAISALQDAAAIYRDTGDRHGEGMALTNLGAALQEVVGRFEEAINALQDAAAIYRETNDRHGEGIALDNLGIALQKVKRSEEAVSAHREARVFFEETGDRHSEGMALNNLGNALRQLGRFEEAVSAYREARVIFEETGDRHSEGMALGNLGAALLKVGRFEEAVSAFQNGAAIYRETGDQYSEGSALGNLGAALHQVKRFEEAISAYQDGATISGRPATGKTKARHWTTSEWCC